VKVSDIASFGVYSHTQYTVNVSDIASFRDYVCLYHRVLLIPSRNFLPRGSHIRRSSAPGRSARVRRPPGQAAARGDWQRVVVFAGLIAAPSRPHQGPWSGRRVQFRHLLTPRSKVQPATFGSKGVASSPGRRLRANNAGLLRIAHRCQPISVPEEDLGAQRAGRHWPFCSAASEGAEKHSSCSQSPAESPNQSGQVCISYNFVDI